MVNGRSYGRQLESYIRSRVERRGEWLEDHFTGLPELLSLAQSPPFAGFQWSGLRGATGVRTLGVRPLLDGGPFFSLSQFEAEGFRVETTRHPAHPAARNATVSHYLIAELIATLRASVCVCAHVPPATWCVLDEHQLRRSA